LPGEPADVYIIAYFGIITIRIEKFRGRGRINALLDWIAGGIDALSTWIAGEIVLALGCFRGYWGWMEVAAFLTMGLLA